MPLGVEFDNCIKHDDLCLYYSECPEVQQSDSLQEIFEQLILRMAPWFVIFAVALLAILPCFEGRQIFPSSLSGFGHTVNVVGGTDVKVIEKWPWQVFIELDDGANQCGGTVLSGKWILTAAHCFDSGRRVTKLLTGTTKRSGIADGAFTTTAEHRCCHKGYNELTFENDVCLVRTTRAIPLQLIKPATLPPLNSQVAIGKTCTVTGWGLDENENLPEELQQADVKIISRKQCVDWHSKNSIVVVNNTLCAGHERGGRDSCGGDSGGPLICGGVLRGITSYGPRYCGQAKAPGIYTDVAKFREWIDQTMADPCPKFHWSPWTGSCAVTCGRGTITKTRTCFDEQNKEVPTSNCYGSGTAVEFCNLDKCPEKYTWTSWTSGTCDVTCGSGSNIETRKCQDEKGNIVQLKNCEGQSTRTVPCDLHKCPEKYTWTSWTSGTCDVTCGPGSNIETRKCQDEKGNVVQLKNCEGQSTRTVPCDLQKCPDTI